MYDDEEDEEMDDAHIERASDDELDEDYPVNSKIKKSAKRLIDESAEEEDDVSLEDE